MDYLSVTALGISIASAAFSCFSFTWTARRDRKQSTLDAYNAMQEQVFDKLNLIRPSEIAEIAKDNKSVQFKEISGLIARIEHFSVGVNTGIYDFKTVYELGNGYLDGHQLKKRITPVIDRKLSTTDHDYYSNIHKLLERMDKETERRKKHGNY